MMGNKITISIHDRMTGYERKSMVKIGNEFKDHVVFCVSGYNTSCFSEDNDIASIYDSDLFMESMARTAASVLKCTPGAAFCYVSGDSMHFLVSSSNSEEKRLTLDAMKMASFMSSMATVYFNTVGFKSSLVFTSRHICLPNDFEVKNYFIWRQNKHFRNVVYNFLDKHNLREENEPMVKFDELSRRASENENWSSVSDDKKNGLFVRFHDAVDDATIEVPSLFGTRNGADYLKDAIESKMAKCGM